ncbi:MAG: diacylglycerol/lipid kinase family protein [Bacteroidota bacterium]
MKKKKKKILFVINPKSRALLNDNLESVIYRILSKDKFEWTFFYTTGDKDNEKLTDSMHKFNPELIIAAGGDGTVNLVASHIIGKDIQMGIIPAGSANGVALNLNIPNDFEEALKKMINTSPKPVDTILINNKFYCLHLSDVGINARIVKRFSQEQLKGISGYAKQLLKELFSPKTSFRFTLKTSDFNKKRKAEMIVIANASVYGTGAIINPNGVMNDGKFEIVIIKPYPWWIVFRFIVAFFTGNLHKMKYVQIITTTKAEITLHPAQDIHIDGEVQNRVKQLKAEIIPDAIEIIY